MNKLLCPDCNSEIGFFAFAKAPTPWHLKCNSCSTKLRLEKNSFLFFFAAVLCGAAIGVLAMRKTLGIPIFLISLGCVIFVFEYLTYSYVRMMQIKLAKK